jgi:hypothetical protein
VPVFPLATVIDYLDDHAGAFTALLTAVLILVTIFTTIQNVRVVREMRRARKAAVAPKLALEFHRLGPTAMTVAIRNVGPGTAFSIDVRLIYEPIREDAGPDEQPWRHNLLMVGEQRDFMPPGELNDNLNGLPRTYRRIRLLGSVYDANGKRHGVDEAIPDLAAWREALGEARQRFVDANPERRQADELSKKLKVPLDGIARQVGSLADEVRALREPPEPPTELGED